MSLPSTPLHTGNGLLLWCRLVLIPLYVIRVLDDYSQNNYGLTESRDGYITQGEYFVNLPDGRLQKVRILLSRTDPELSCVRSPTPWTVMPAMWLTLSTPESLSILRSQLEDTRAEDKTCSVLLSLFYTEK